MNDQFNPPSESQEDILASLVKTYGKPIYNCCPGYNSAGDFAQWLAERVKGLQTKIALLEKHNQELLAELELHRSQEKVSAEEEKIPRGPDRIRQEFEAIVSCIDPLAVHDGINEDTYERQTLIRCVAAATTLLMMHFDEEIKRIGQDRGIDRNSPAFTEILKECVEMMRPKANPKVK